VLANFAEITTLVETPTGTVVIGKVAVVLPAGTTTELGIAATDGTLEVSVTVVPPVPAGALKVTVPCDEVPPERVLGFAVTEATPTIFTDGPPDGVSKLALSSTARLKTVNVPPVFATHV